MHRIDHKSAATSLPEYLETGTPGYFDYGNVLTETLPTQMHHDFLNDLQENICYAIEQLGVALDKNNQHQLFAALQQYILIGASGAGVAISSVQGDLNPKLGGDLILNSHQIVNSLGDIRIIPNGSGSIDFNKTSLNIKNNLVNKAEPTTKIEFGYVYPLTFKVLNNIILDVTSGGIRLSNSGASANKILNENDFISADSQALSTQRAAKTFVDNRFTYTSSKYLYLIPGNSSGAQIEASGRYFIGGPFAASSGTITYTALPIPKNCVISNLKFKSLDSWNISDSTNVIATLFVNGYATALTITLPTTTSAPNIEDTTHSVSVAAGDLIEIDFSATGTPSVVPRINTAEVTIKIT